MKIRHSATHSVGRSQQRELKVHQRAAADMLEADELSLAEAEEMLRRFHDLRVSGHRRMQAMSLKDGQTRRGRQLNFAQGGCAWVVPRLNDLDGDIVAMKAPFVTDHLDADEVSSLLRREILQNLVLNVMADHDEIDSPAARIYQWYTKPLQVDGHTYLGFFTMEPLTPYQHFADEHTLLQGASARVLQARLHTRLRHVFELLDSVCYLHLSGIYHGDLQVGNLMVDTSDAGAPCLCLVDFGNSIDHQATTMSFVSKYQVPEVVAALHSHGGSSKCHPLDWRKIDVYCLGILVQYLLIETDPLDPQVDVQARLGQLMPNEARDGRRRPASGKGDQLYFLCNKAMHQTPTVRPTASELLAVSRCEAGRAN